MLVLSGKKLKNIVIGLFAVFMVVALTLGSKENNLNYIDTVSLPVSGKVVVIDAGHGIPDEGAEVGDGTTEAQTNL